MNTNGPPACTRRYGRRELIAGLVAAALTAALLGVPVTGIADDRPHKTHERGDHDDARRALLSGEVLSLRQVLDIVATKYPGEPIEIEFEHDDGMYLYEIKLLQASGRIIKMKVDAANGDIVAVKARGTQEEDDD